MHEYTTQHSSLRTRLTRLTRLSFPRRFPIVQFPNLPLASALIAGAAADRAHGTSHSYLRAFSYLAMGVWAYEEMTTGVNWFRRLLGLVFLGLVLAGIADSIPHR